MTHLFLQNIKQVKENLEKIKFSIKHSQHISHTSHTRLTYFGNFEAFFALYFTSTKNNTPLLYPSSNENFDV